MGIPHPAFPRIPNPGLEPRNILAQPHSSFTAFEDLNTCQGLREPRKCPTAPKTWRNLTQIPPGKADDSLELSHFPPASHSMIFLKCWGRLLEGAKLRDWGWGDPRAWDKYDLVPFQHFVEKEFFVWEIKASFPEFLRNLGGSGCGICLWSYRNCVLRKTGRDLDFPRSGREGMWGHLRGAQIHENPPRFHPGHFQSWINTWGWRSWRLQTPQIFLCWDFSQKINASISFAQLYK